MAAPSSFRFLQQTQEPQQEKQEADEDPFGGGKSRKTNDARERSGVSGL